MIVRTIPSSTEQLHLCIHPESRTMQELFVVLYNSRLCGEWCTKTTSGSVNIGLTEDYPLVMLPCQLSSAGVVMISCWSWQDTPGWYHLSGGWALHGPSTIAPHAACAAHMQRQTDHQGPHARLSK